MGQTFSTSRPVSLVPSHQPPSLHTCLTDDLPHAATDCSIYHAVLAMNWCAWAVLVPPYLGLLSLSIKESRRGNRHVRALK